MSSAPLLRWRTLAKGLLLLLLAGAVWRVFFRPAVTTTFRHGAFKSHDGDSPDEPPLVVSANWDQRRLTRDEPFGAKGFVVFAKGGTGGIYTPAQDAAEGRIFPTGAGSPSETLK